MESTAKIENSMNDYDNKMIEAFVGKPEKTLWYKNAFNKYSVNGVDKMSWNWSWWAFFGGIFYLLYRKAYLAALGLFVLTIVISLIPFGGLVIWIVPGGLAPYFVYKIYQSKRAEIEVTIEDEQTRIDTMRAIGGYNDWAIWIAVIIHVVLWTSVLYAMMMMLPVLVQ